MKEVFMLTIGKELKFTGEKWPQFSHEIGDSVHVLEKLIKEKYKVELIKEDQNHFPWFTDGGFLYECENEDWKYTFTCHPRKLHSITNP